MVGEVKILLTSDLHLGIKSDILNITDEIRLNTFRRIVSTAIKHDLMIISGDLIDNTDISEGLLNIINDEFRKLKSGNTEIVYLPGNGELNNDGEPSRILEKFNDPHIFTKVNEVYNYSKNGQRLYIYGTGPGSDKKFSDLERKTDNGFHIVMNYGDCNLSTEDMKLNMNALQKNDYSGHDFFALGSMHNFKIYKSLDNIVGLYPGSPEATSLDETGDRYIISFSVSNDRISNMKRLSVNTITVEQMNLNINDNDKYESILSVLEKNGSKKKILNLIIDGSRKFHINEKDFEKYNSLFHDLIVVDNSCISADFLIDKYKNENSIRGEFFRTLEMRISNGKIPEHLKAEDISASLDILMNNEYDSLEEWVCNISDA